MSEKKSKKPGRPRLHGEVKNRHTIRVTDTAWEGIKYLAEDAGVSLSEYLEALGRMGLKARDTGG